MTTADEDALKIKGPGGIFLIGFLPITSIPRPYFMASSVSIEPQADNQIALNAMSSLATVLSSKSQVGLVRVVKKENAEPYLGCLIPNQCSKGSFVVQRLPFYEDIRDYAFPSLDRYRLSIPEKGNEHNEELQKHKKQRQIISNYINELTFAKVTTSSIITFNPVFQSVLAELQRKTFKNTVKMVEIPDIISLKTAVTSKPEVQHLLQDIKTEFDLEVIEKKEKKRKIFWSELQVDNGSISTSSAADKSDIIELQQLIQHQNTAVPSAAIKILDFHNTITPVEEFQAIMATNSLDHIVQSLSVLQSIVIDLITVG